MKARSCTLKRDEVEGIVDTYAFQSGFFFGQASPSVNTFSSNLGLLAKTFSSNLGIQVRIVVLRQLRLSSRHFFRQLRPSTKDFSRLRAT